MQDPRSIPFSSTKPQTHQLNQPNNHQSQPSHHQIQPSQPIKSNRPTASQDHPWRATTTPPTAIHVEPQPPHPRRSTTTHEQTPDHGDLNPTYPKPPHRSVPHQSEEERRECGRKRETLKVRGRQRVRLKNNLGVLNFLFLFLFFRVFIFISIFFLFFFHLVKFYKLIFCF